jgi:hypothetical protein
LVGVSLALLLFPSTWLRWLSLLDIVTKYRTWIAGVALLSGAVLTADLLGIVWKELQSWYWRRRADSVAKDYLHNLTTVEKGALQCYISNDTESWIFDGK